VIDAYGKVRRRHLIRKNLFQVADAAGALKQKPVLRIGIQRPEERHALNVVPMKMRNENVRGKRTVAEFALQLPAEHAKAGAAIEDVNAVADAYFDAGGVPSIAHVFGLWSGCGTPYSPELNPHRLPGPREGPPARSIPWYLPMRRGWRQLPDWFRARFTRMAAAEQARR